MSTRAERTSAGRVGLSTLLAVAGVYAVAAADVLAVASGPTAGAVAHAVILFVLLNTYLLSTDSPQARALVALSAVSLLELIELGIPASGLRPVLREALVALLLLYAAMVAGRITGVDRAPLRINRGAWRSQLAIAACGIPVGLAGQLILDPQPLAKAGDPGGLVLGALVLAGLVAPALELLFRWGLQGTFLDLYGAPGLILTSGLFASLYVGTRSPGFVVLMLLTGFGLALAVRRSGTVWGAVGAHGLLAVGLLIVWPAVLG